MIFLALLLISNKFVQPVLRASACLCAWGWRRLVEAFSFAFSNAASVNVSINNLFTPYGIPAVCQVWVELGACGTCVEILF